MRKAFEQLLVETYSLSRFLHRFLTDMKKAKEPEALIQLVDNYEPRLPKSNTLPDFCSSIRHCFRDLRNSQTEYENVYNKFVRLWSQLVNIEHLFPWEEIEAIYDSRRRNIPP